MPIAVVPAVTTIRKLVSIASTVTFLAVFASACATVRSTGRQTLRAGIFVSDGDPHPDCKTYRCPVPGATVFAVDAGARITSLGVADGNGQFVVEHCADVVGRNRFLLVCKENMTCGVVDLVSWGEFWCDETDPTPHEVAMGRIFPLPAELAALKPSYEEAVNIVVVWDNQFAPMADALVRVVRRDGGLGDLGRTDKSGSLEVDFITWEIEDPILILAEPMSPWSAGAVRLSESRSLKGRTIVIQVAGGST